MGPAGLKIIRKKDFNLFLVPFLIITNMFLFINNPGLYFTHDVLQAEKPKKSVISVNVQSRKNVLILHRSDAYWDIQSGP